MSRNGIFATLVTAALTAAQDPTPAPPDATELIARFTALPTERRTQVLRNLERRLQRDGDDAVQRIVARRRGRDAYPPVTERRWFLPEDYAPVAKPRTLVGPDSDLHRAATRGMVHATPLPDLAAEVVFDPATATIVRTQAPIDDVAIFTNLAHGYPPGCDEAVATVLAALAGDPAQRRLATWFDHLYADRDGHVFANTTLFDAWASGNTIEMPDTDVIAFAREILGTRSFVAPLPADRRRDRLYEKVREAFTRHRDHTALCFALAGSFVAATPPIDPAYRSLLPRCHWLWATSREDPIKVAEFVAATGDRAAVLRAVDAAMERDGTAAEQRSRDLADLAAWLRRLAAAEIARATD